MDTKKLIIGVTGFAGSGKDTIADYLVNIHQFYRESFASSLKDAVSATFGWDRDMLEGRSRQSRAWREQVDTWWAERLNMPHLTPRWVLQYWGTDVLRQNFHDNFWIASLENKLRLSTDNVVISDCRFPNEITAIRRQGGIVIRVTRGTDPEWYKYAEIVNRGPEKNPRWALSKDHMLRYNIHPSETAWIGTEFDFVLDNNGTMQDLYRQVDSLLVRDISASPDAAIPG